VRLHLHLGPAVEVDLVGEEASLGWTGLDGLRHHAALSLPSQLLWSAVRGRADPPLGWYSPRFGVKEPITTLVGVGEDVDHPLLTSLAFETPAGSDG
jgi:hypothetical protein